MHNERPDPDFPTINDIKQGFQVVDPDGVSPLAIEAEHGRHFHLHHGKSGFGKIAKRDAILALIGSMIRNFVQTVSNQFDQTAGGQVCAIFLNVLGHSGSG